MNEGPKLGKIIEPGDLDRRDAIHVAVCPITAAHPLPPGYRVGLDAAGKAADLGEAKVVGIVDPFLTHWVDAGQRFWLFLLPGTITGLRHLWQHPAFDSRGAIAPRPVHQEVASE